MPVSSFLNRGDTRKYVETVTSGSTEGVITITHNLGTQDLTMYVRQTSNDWLVLLPYDPLNDNQVQIETTYNPSREFEITLIG